MTSVDRWLPNSNIRVRGLAQQQTVWESHIDHDIEDQNVPMPSIRLFMNTQTTHSYLPRLAISSESSPVYGVVTPTTRSDRRPLPVVPFSLERVVLVRISQRMDLTGHPLP